MRYSRQDFENWVNQLDRDITELNSHSYDPLLNLGDKFEIGFRGKLHRVVLIKNGETIACGIRNITESIIRYKRKYSL